jgi:hypothetical protein
VIGCTPVVAVETPGYEAIIRDVLGTISAATGVQFREDPAARPTMTYTHAPPPASLAGVNAYYNGDTIGIATYAFSPKYAKWLLLHETLHWLGMGHNDRRDSVMNLGFGQKRPVLQGWDLKRARALTQHCR